MAMTALGIGSGLDLNGLLDQLRSAERQKLEPIVQQKSSYQTQISAYGKLEGLLSSFRDSADSLNETSLFQSVKSSVSGDAVKVAADQDAAVGTHSVEVHDLARAYKIATGGVADKASDLGAGTVTIDLADGETLSVDLAADASSLEDLRDAINDQSGGARASIVNDGSASPYRLVLSSTETGTENAISAVDFGALGGSLTLDAATETTAMDASVTVDGVTITSQSNQVEGALEGVTLSLQEQGLATAEVTRDTKRIMDRIENFVASYNELQQGISGLSGYDAESGSAGPLLGDSALRTVESSLRSAMNHVVDEGSLDLLSDTGISLQVDGTLKMDTEKLTELVDEQPGALEQFFAGSAETGGLAGNLKSSLNQTLSDHGVLGTTTGGLETSIKQVEERYSRMEDRISATIERYRVQFSQLDSEIARMNSTTEYLGTLNQTLNLNQKS
ncbi:MAG: flagellar filament capping protein FliD [Pseudohongiellaceae bacterium]